VALLARLERLLSLCFAVAHGRSEAEVLSRAALPLASLLCASLRALALRPAYALLEEKGGGELILVVRGTHSPRDALTCLTASVQPHHALDAGSAPAVLGYAHSGILTAARWLLAEVGPPLRAALAARPEGTRLTITGHSMGAGAAALLTQMLREASPATSHATCVAFSCPAVVTSELSQFCAPFVTSFLAGADIIPTASAAAVAQLRGDVAAARSAQREEARRAAATTPGGRRGGRQLVAAALGAAGAALRAAPGAGCVASCGRGGPGRPAATPAPEAAGAFINPMRRPSTPPPPLRRRVTQGASALLASGACWAGRAVRRGPGARQSTGSVVSSAGGARSEGDGGSASDDSDDSDSDSEAAAATQRRMRRPSSFDESRLRDAADLATSSMETAVEDAVPPSEPAAHMVRTASEPAAATPRAGGLQRASAAPAPRLLFPAGRILHAVWDANDDDEDGAETADAGTAAPSASDEPLIGRGVERLPRIEAAEARAKPPWRAPPGVRRGRWALYDGVPAARYGRLLLSRRMLLDHFMPTLSDHLLGTMATLGAPAPPDSPVAAAAAAAAGEQPFRATILGALA